MDYGDRAVDAFSKGYNCAQATASAFAEQAGLDKELVLRLVAGFGGGVGGLRETCGAVSAMVAVLGMFCGSYEPNDHKAKTDLYKKVRRVSGEFSSKFGTTCCRELLSKANCLCLPDPSVRNAEYYSKRPCAHFVKGAAEIVASVLREEKVVE